MQLLTDKASRSALGGEIIMKSIFRVLISSHEKVPDQILNLLVPFKVLEPLNTSRKNKNEGPGGNRSNKGNMNSPFHTIRIGSVTSISNRRPRSTAQRPSRPRAYGSTCSYNANANANSNSTPIY